MAIKPLKKLIWNLGLGFTVSCGCKNKENQVNFRNNDDLVDGTRKSAIDGTRKRNKNNASGVTGVHYDKERVMQVVQITFQRVNHHLGRFKAMGKIALIVFLLLLNICINSKIC